MKKVQAAICDEEELYCSQLSAYLQAEQKEEMEFCIYSSKEGLRNALKEKKPDVVLMTEEFFDGDILETKDVLFVVFSEGIIQREWSTYPYIMKYQPVEEIIRELFRLAGECLAQGAEYVRQGTNREIISFFSPNQDELQMYLAMTYARLRGKEKKVLYLNLMECSGFEMLFDETYKNNLGDLLYYLRQNKDGGTFHFEEMIYSMEEIDYIPPVLNGEVLQEAGEADFSGMLNWILEHTTYEVIVLDLGGMIQGFFSLLGRCNRIFCITGEDYGAKCRLAQFEKCLNMHSEILLKERLQVISPRLQRQDVKGNIIEAADFEFGELGDYVRSRLIGDGKIAGADG